MTGTLYLVATPIGNLQDISFRAVETLRNADLIACEDTRHSIKLLNHLRISNRLVSYHEFNEQERAEQFVEEMAGGKNIAVISDAGTPGVSDPSFRVVRLAIEAGIKVVSIPGPAAFVNAAVISGLPTDSIFFGGFLPSKKSERRRRLAQISAVPATIVLYESPHRLLASLSDCLAVLGDRQASVSRELTKMHEETISATLSQLLAHFGTVQPKGEFVISIDRERMTDKMTVPDETALPERVLQLIEEGLDRKAALKKAAKEFGISKSEAYRLIQT